MMMAARTEGPVDGEILERLDRIEVSIGQLAGMHYGISGAATKPLLAGFMAKYERRRDDQYQEAQVRDAEQRLQALREAA